MLSFICSSPRTEEKGQIFWDYLITYEMDTKPRNPKMVQNYVKINLDSTSTKTIYIHDKVEI